MADSDALREAAARAAKQAYAPYSGLRVGAALRSTSGLVYCGCNVENGALPVGACAERAAIAAAVLAEGRVSGLPRSRWSRPRAMDRPCPFPRAVPAGRPWWNSAPTPAWVFSARTATGS